MKQLAAISLALALFCGAILARAAEQPAAGDAATSAGQWIQLFNGKNLDGWTPKICGYELGENPGNIFRVENGAIKVSYDGFEKFTNQFGHLFYKTPFSHYILRIEYRFIGEQAPGGPGWAFRNSGVMLHSPPPATMGKNQEFPISIEVQFLGGGGKGERSTINLCTPSTNVVIDGKLETKHVINSKSKTFHGDQWVTAEVEVHGDGKIIHRANGEQVLEYEKPQLDPTDPLTKPFIPADGNLLLKGGYFSLQAESHGVEFRKVELLNLEPSGAGK